MLEHTQSSSFFFNSSQLSFFSNRFASGQGDETAVKNDSATSGGGVDGDEVIPVDTTTNAVSTTSDDDVDDDDNSQQQFAPSGTQVSLSFSSYSSNGISSKVFEYEITSALQGRLSGSAISSIDEPRQGRHGRGHDFGRGFGLEFGQGGRGREFGGISGAVERILGAINDHLSQFSGHRGNSSGFAVEAEKISLAISQGVQSTQTVLGSLGVEGQGDAVDEAGAALQDDVTAQVDEAAAENTSSESTAPASDAPADTTSSNTSPTNTTQTSSNSDGLRHHVESFEESFRARRNSGLHSGPITSRFSSTSREFSLDVVTLDGDKISVSFDQDFAKYRERTADSVSSGRYSSSDFQIKVEGDLDEGELEALNELFANVSSLAESFFQGNVEEAFNHAINLGLDESELASFSLNLSEEQVKSSIKTYDGIADLGESRGRRGGRGGPKGIQGLGDFVKNLRDTLGSKEAASFKNSEQLIKTLLSQQANGIAENLANKELAEGAAANRNDYSATVDDILNRFFSELTEASAPSKAA
ncbi:MAG: hypothetical protein COB04_05020 [Gammaproteobacteria bacterium]|nr:MAG: hypothetical protein COB04_05020 [Gammaproteobacteria bacterium]